MNSNPRFFKPEGSLITVQSILVHIYEQVWADQTDKALTELMKYEVCRSTMATTSQMTKFLAQEPSRVPQIHKQLEPEHIEIDHWADGNIKSTMPVIDFKRSKTNATNLSGAPGAKRITTKGSTGLARQDSIPSPTKKPTIKVNPTPEQSGFLRVQEEPTANDYEQRMRGAYLATLKHHQQVQRLSKLQVQNEEKYKQAQQRFSKQKKNYTYDYSGKIINYSNDANSTKSKRPLLSHMNSNITRETELLQKVEKKVLQPQAINQKTNTLLLAAAKKTARVDTKFQFSSDTQREIIEDTNSISEGVKFIEISGDRQTLKERQTPSKYDSPSILKFKLREFKDYIKERRFKQRLFEQKTAPKRSIPGTVNTTKTIAPAFASEPQIGQPHRLSSYTVDNAEQILSKKPLKPTKALDRRLNLSIQDIAKASSTTPQPPNNNSEGFVVLPEITMKMSQRSSKYFQDSARDKSKARVKSLKVNNQHLESSLFYKPGRKKHVNFVGTRARIESSLTINEDSFNKQFQNQLTAPYL